MLIRGRSGKGSTLKRGLHTGEREDSVCSTGFSLLPRPSRRAGSTLKRGLHTEGGENETGEPVND